MPLVTDDGVRVAEWVAAGAFAPNGYGPGFQAVGVENDKHELVAGMVFTDIVRNFNTEIHLAIDDPQWVRLGFYKYTWQYAFLVLRVKRVTALVVMGTRGTSAF